MVTGPLPGVDGAAWHLLAFFLFAASFGALLYTLRRVSWFDHEPSRRFVAWFLIGRQPSRSCFPAPWP